MPTFKMYEGGYVSAIALIGILIPSNTTVRRRRRSRKECDFLLKVCLACFIAYVFTGAEFRQGMGDGGRERNVGLVLSAVYS